MNIGAHISSAGSFPRAAQNARKLDLDCVQFFTRNPRGGRQRSLGEQEVSEWHRSSARAQLEPVVMHTPYTVNLASERSDVVEFSRRIIVEDLRRCAILQSPYLVLHPGNCGSADEVHGLDLIIEGLDEVCERAEESINEGARPVLELMSGQGNELGSTLRQMKIILNNVKHPDFILFCVDTCHCFARGYPLDTAGGVERFVKSFDKVLGLERLAVLHLNDSQHPKSSRRDRHAKLGEGRLGQTGIRAIINNPHLKDLPLIMEVPVKEEEEYKEQAKLVRDWVD